MQPKREMQYLLSMRKRVLLLAGGLTVTAQVFCQASPDCPTQPATLRAMRNCYRPVLVFAPHAKSPAFNAQQALLDQYADDMMDRNLLYVPVLAESAQLDKPLDAPYVVLPKSELGAIRARFHVAPSQFTLILVGKDGGEKFRSAKPVSVLELDALVDAMPMGHEEKNARDRKAE
jgi:hypothetical protein